MHKHLYTKRSVITACIPTSRLIDANAAASGANASICCYAACKTALTICCAITPVGGYSLPIYMHHWC